MFTTLGLCLISGFLGGIAASAWPRVWCRIVHHRWIDFRISTDKRPEPEKHRLCGRCLRWEGGNPFVDNVY